MFLRSKLLLRDFLKATNFWRENYLVVRELKYFRRLVFGAVFMSLIAAILAGLTIAAIGVFLQGLTTPNEPPIRSGVEFIDVWVLATKAPTLERIYRISLLLLVVIWVQAICQYIGLFLFKLSAFKLLDRLHKAIFEQLQSLSLIYFLKTSSSKLINSLITECDQIQAIFTIFSTLVIQGSRLLIYVVLLLLLSWQLSLGALLGFGFLSVCVSVITAHIRERSFSLPLARQNFTSIGMEYIHGIRTIHASVTQEFERQRFYQASQKLLNTQNKLHKLSQVVHPLTQGLSSTLLIAMVVLAFHFLVKNEEMRIASLLTFLFALSRTMPIVSQISNSWADMSSLQGSIRNVKELLERNNKPYFNNGKLEFMGLKSSIDIVGMDFSYDSHELVLHDVNLSIEKGQMTALVGSSGAGKSTLADLIPRFFDPTRGEILVDGIDLRQLDINSLRRRMAIVSQDTFIFNASVRENIAYGLNNIDNAKVLEAARLANAYNFILELGQGLDTNLGDRGVRLSGGQRQRIAIARALLRNPEILILDEATSALDSETERLIQDSLEKLSAGRTVIAIAHRLSTIMNADKVVVLEQGRIVEQGSYRELLDSRGKLWKYHQMQNNVSSISLS